MKIVVIGGTGLIGSKVVANLRQKGHEAFAAAPNTGVNTITGEGLREALAGAQVVIDLANSPSFEDKAALEFFETSGRNLLATEAASGSVRHHVALSIVGCDRTPDIGYFRAKVAQEKVIKTSGIPTPSFAQPSSWNSSAPPPIQVRMETSSGFRPACSSPSQRTTLLPSLPMWRSRSRETASSRLPARNERPSTNSSPAI
jgi:uncharacterized protein YbjT (DUF2867 family)